MSEETVPADGIATSETASADDAAATSETATANGAVTASETAQTATVTATQPTPSSRSQVQTFVHREVITILATPSFFLLCVALLGVIAGTALVGGGFEAGYVSTAIDLLTPMQLLIPLIAVALGYTAILGDARRGELDVFETYPVRPWELVAGVFLGRALGVALAVTLPLVLLIGPIAMTDTPRLPMYATHTGADSPFLYLRFVVLTLVFALVMVAVAVALSALVSATRTAIAVAGVALFVLLVGFDLAVAFGFSVGFVGDGGLTSALALSPLSAYRGLVLETAVVVTEGTGPAYASPIASLLSLALWGGGSLLIATLAVRR